MAAEAYVVDTSVLVRWYIAQVGWEHAQKIRDRFLSGDLDLETVECARFELPHVLRRMGLEKGRMSRDGYLAACRTVDDFGITVAATDVDAVERAAALSADHRIAFFDAVFVARALEQDLPLLTADLKLAHAAERLVTTVVLDGVGPAPRT